jgi:hypothetical protein
MPQSYHQAVVGAFEAGSVFKLYHPNYSSFMHTEQSFPTEEQVDLIYQFNDMVISEHNKHQY